MIAYASKALSSQEQAYSSTELEILALLYGCSHFRSYLLGRNIYATVDGCSYLVAATTGGARCGRRPAHELRQTGGRARQSTVGFTFYLSVDFVSANIRDFKDAVCIIPKRRLHNHRSLGAEVDIHPQSKVQTQGYSDGR